MSRLAILCLALALAFAAAEAARSADKINSLPNVDPRILGTQYSGYYEVDAKHGRFLHYWFVQAEVPSEHVILWLNGGPGCSSLDGFMYEHGPFIFTGEGENNVTLTKNPYSWNRVANMIYLESPAGVGFSYSNTPGDYFTCNDTRTADDAFVFLTKWFKDFPEYIHYKFYITGESFGGIYVPTLAARVLQGNAKGESNINLVGVAVGNGVTDPVADSPMNNLLPFMYGHFLYSSQTEKQIQLYCGVDPNGAMCQQLINDVQNVFNNDLLNIYDIYASCYHQRPLTKWVPGKNAPQLFAPAMEVPCINARKAELWLNQANVKDAIHVKPTISWSICSGTINENYNHNIQSMLPLYNTFLQNGVRVLIYSGDVDASVPSTGSQYWTSRLQVSSPLSLWQPWSMNGQLAGFETVYPNDFRFVTVRGAGHMVPQFKPPQGFYMISKWLLGENLA